MAAHTAHYCLCDVVLVYCELVSAMWGAAVAAHSPHSDVTVAAAKVWCAGERGVAAERSLSGGRHAVEQVAGCDANAAEDWAASAVGKRVSLRGHAATCYNCLPEMIASMTTCQQGQMSAAMRRRSC